MKCFKVLKSMLCVTVAVLCTFVTVAFCTFMTACSKKQSPAPQPAETQNVSNVNAFRVDFECGEGVSLKIFSSREFKNPSASTTGFSRDKNGQPKKDGFGEINFEIKFSTGFELDDIILTSGYDELLTPEETGRENTFRITGIVQDLIVRVFSISQSQPRARLEKFSSLTNENGDIQFAWENVKNDFDSVNIEVKFGETAQNFTATGNTFTYPASQVGVTYNFSFTPMLNGKAAGRVYTCSRFRYPDLSNQDVVKVNIQTQNFVWPSRDTINPPVGYLGGGIRNNDYQQCLFSIINESGEEVFSSSSSDYLAAKLKIRGNTSAYGEKVSYKIKLSKKADILSKLISGRDNDSFKDKEWILLKQGDNLKNVAGWEISKIVGMDYTPAYRYVALTINGDFRGTYILCESVKQGNVDGENQSRVQVDDDGFIVELDAYWWNEDLYFKTQYETGAMRYTFKHPDSDDINEKSPEYKYIQDYINSFESALFDLKSERYLDFIDEESFAKWLLCQDIFSQNDAGGANIYLTKKDSKDSKLKMSVLWDFDCAFEDGTQNSLAFINEVNLFYVQFLLQRKSFLEKYVSIYESIKNQILTSLTEKLNEFATDEMEILNNLEASRWGTSTNFKTEKSEMLSWMTSHLEWFDDDINSIKK